MRTTKSHSVVPPPFTIFGASVSWVALCAAIIAATSLIPLFPYPEGGGFDPLAAHLVPLMVALLGPLAGLVTVFVGGVVGMFLCPPAYVMGILTVIDNNVGGALSTMGITQAKWNIYRKLWVIWGISQIIITMIVPYVWPGPPTYTPVIQPDYFISFLPWFVFFPLFFTRLGTELVPRWLRSLDLKELALGVWLLLAFQSSVWYFTWWWIYNTVYAFPITMNILQNYFYYSWVWYGKNTLVTPIYVAVIRALRKAGVARVPYSLLE